MRKNALQIVARDCGFEFSGHFSMIPRGLVSDVLTL